ncbi:MAG: hypothetical protein ACI81T_003021 [Bacteroidia bacterium]|jgi:hypothetical protein
MNRSNYFDTIEEKTNILAERIKSRGRLNLLNLNLHNENFYFHFLNLLYGWNSFNANPISGNIEGIDLIDHDNKIILQVSSTSTKAKIEKSLSKKIIEQYSGYRFKFISIARDSDDLRKMSFSNPFDCAFNPAEDIIDKNSILNHILIQDINTQKKICKFVMDELGSPLEELKLETTIADLINFLYEHKPTKSKLPISITPFEIEDKISFNNLEISRTIIEDLSVYHPSISEKYSVYDQEGINKSRSVIHTISRFYREEVILGTSSDETFLKIVDKVADFAMSSDNFVYATKELLQLSAEILTVDTFLRCKIFKNPPNIATTK